MMNVITTVDKREILEHMARVLLEKRLISCLQIIGPIKSIYRWKGRVEEVEEWLGFMKTRDELYGDVEREIRALHPYEVPEIAGIKADRLLSSYGEWVLAETSAVAGHHNKQE